MWQFTSLLGTPSTKTASWLHVLKFNSNISGYAYGNLMISGVSTYAYRFPSSYTLLYTGYLTMTQYGQFTKLSNIAGSTAEQITQFRICRYSGSDDLYLDAYISGSNLQGDGYRIYTMILSTYVRQEQLRNWITTFNTSDPVTTSPSNTYATITLS